MAEIVTTQNVLFGASYILVATSDLSNPRSVKFSTHWFLSNVVGAIINGFKPSLEIEYIAMNVLPRRSHAWLYHHLI